MLFYKLFSSFEIIGAIKDSYKFKTLNLNTSASRQNIKNLVGNFEAIYVGNMIANFQVSSFTSEGGEWGDRQTWAVKHS